MSAHVPSEVAPPMNHVFVDYENVRDFDVSLLGSRKACFTLLLGAQQTKLNVALVEKLMEHAESVQLVRLTSQGKDALDFTLAYYLGRAAITDPTAYFHIVSQDTGFDPLIAHLKSRHVHAHRHADFTTLTFGAAKPVIPAAADPLACVVEHLRKSAKQRPKTKKRLATYLLARLGNATTEAEVAALIESLCKGGLVTVDEKGAVIYHLGPT
jgi:hypothetical protein